LVGKFNNFRKENNTENLRLSEDLQEKAIAHSRKMFEVDQLSNANLEDYKGY